MRTAVSEVSVCTMPGEQQLLQDIVVIAGRTKCLQLPVPREQETLPGLQADSLRERPRGQSCEALYLEERQWFTSGGSEIRTSGEITGEKTTGSPPAWRGLAWCRQQQHWDHQPG